MARYDAPSVSETDDIPADETFDSRGSFVLNDISPLREHRTVMSRNELSTPDGAPPRKHAVRQRKQEGHWPLRWCRLPRTWWTLWLMEIICFLVSSALLVATLVILYVFDGDSLPHWHYGITLNTIVAIFTTVSTFTLMGPISAGLGQLKWLRVTTKKRELEEFRILHDASRGVEGSLVLLLRRRGGLLATAGAILTVLALVISPFVQQVVGYRLQVVPIESAYLPRWTSWFVPEGSQVGAWGNTGPSGWVTTSAIWRAASERDGTAFNVAPTCSTGNCTWPQYTTIGFCSSCTNISSLLTYSGNSSSLPNGMILNTYPEYPGAANMTNTFWRLPGGSLVYKETGGIALDLFYIATDGGNEPWSAFECILQYCIKTMKASMENNVFTDTVISEWVNNSDAAVKWGTTMMEYVNMNYPETDLGFDSNLNLIPPGMNETFPNDLGLPTGFYVSWQYATFVGFTLAPVLIGSEFGHEYEPTGSLGSWLESGSSIENFTSNAASALTATAREAQYSILSGSYDTINMTNGVDVGYLIVGTANVNEYRIDIHWLWMAPPIVVLLFSLVFFAIIVHQTHQRALEPWKQSILPVLYHGLSDVVEEHEWRELEEMDAMDRRARETVVGLSRDQRRKLEVSLAAG